MTSGHYNDSSIENQSYLVAPDMGSGMYDGTSSDSSASSPLNCNVSSSPFGALVDISNVST
jgi:AP-1-like factor